MGINVYPSLTNNANAVTEPGEVLLSVLRHMFATPASSSDHYEGESYSYKASFRRFEADFGNQPSKLCEQWASAITQILANYFPTKRFNVDCYFKYIDDATGNHVEPDPENSYHVRYTVFLDVQMYGDDGELKTIIHSDMVDIDPITFEFNIKFKGATNATG